MSIAATTTHFENWLSHYVPLESAALAIKHQRMAESPETYLRSTFYRWARRWPVVCPELLETPPVLAIGDHHIGNFGVWRDGQGRLCWGIQDFDEAAIIPYASDLVRLAASALLAIESNRLAIGAEGACQAVLAGYREGIDQGGTPIVLEEQEHRLRLIILEHCLAPHHFWRQIEELPRLRGLIPPEASAAIEAELPPDCGPRHLVQAPPEAAGLGRPQYTWLTTWYGGRLARQVRALAPSAWYWAQEIQSVSTEATTTLFARAIRCPDPFARVTGRWLVRRLAPDCSRLEMNLRRRRDAELVLTAMGRETANVHCASADALQAIQRDLRQRPATWLLRAGAAMAEASTTDWHDWQRSFQHRSTTDDLWPVAEPTAISQLH